MPLHLPPPVIQSRLPGLLSLLNLKNGGKNPELMGNVLTPTYDMLRQYMNGQAETLSTAANLPATGVYGSLVSMFAVPNSQWWFVHNFSVQVIANVGDAFDSFCLGFNLDACNFVLSEMLDLTVAAVQRKRFLTMRFESQWVAPGASLGLNIGSITNTGGLANYGAQVRITRLPI